MLLAPGGEAAHHSARHRWQSPTEHEPEGHKLDAHADREFLRRTASRFRLALGAHVYALRVFYVHRASPVHAWCSVGTQTMARRACVAPSHVFTIYEACAGPNSSLTAQT